MVEEVTLEKISNLEDEYSKMKKALLSSMESDDDYVNSDDEGFPNAKESKTFDASETKTVSEAANTFGAPQNTTEPSNLNSRSFLDDSSNHKNLSKTHGKTSAVDDFVDSELKLGNYCPLPVDLKHEAVLDRKIHQDHSKASSMRGPTEEVVACQPTGRKVAHSMHLSNRRRCKKSSFWLFHLLLRRSWIEYKNTFYRQKRS